MPRKKYIKKSKQRSRSRRKSSRSRQSRKNSTWTLNGKPTSDENRQEYMKSIHAKQAVIKQLKEVPKDCKEKYDYYSSLKNVGRDLWKMGNNSKTDIPFENYLAIHNALINIEKTLFKKCSNELFGTRMLRLINERIKHLVNMKKRIEDYVNLETRLQSLRK